MIWHIKMNKDKKLMIYYLFKLIKKIQNSFCLIGRNINQKKVKKMRDYFISTR